MKKLSLLKWIREKIFFPSITFFIFVSFGYSQTIPTEWVIDRFSSAINEDRSPKNWESLTFKKIPKHTQYRILEEDGNFFLQAKSDQSASGLLKRVTVSIKDYPILNWRWKIERLIPEANAKKKSGDDYPARVYVAFKYNPNSSTPWEKAKYAAAKAIYGSYPPQCALNYVWDNQIPKGSIFDNPYSDRTKMIVLQSGSEKVGEWVREERNILEDYRRAFAGDPPEIEFIAVMSDSDNTKSSAVAYYDDLVFLSD